jgi:hypothetical protein
MPDSCLVQWTKLANTTLNGTTLVKTGTLSSWNSGARSVDYLPMGVDGWAEMTILETNTQRLFGLASLNSSSSNTSINYGIRVNASGIVAVLENGVSKGNFGSYTVGDKFRVRRIGTSVSYAKNGSVFYTSTVPSTTNLYVDVSIHTPNATIHNVYASFGCEPINPCANFNINIDAVGHETCAGLNDGFVDISVTQAGTTYQWLDNPALINGDRTNMAPGLYTLVAYWVGSTCTDTIKVRIAAGPNCNPYIIPNDTLPCDTTFFCVPLIANTPVNYGIEGLDFCLQYNPYIMQPTGMVYLGNVATSGGNANYNFSDNGSGTVNVGIYYTSGAGSYLQGSGVIACVEFRLVHGYNTYPGTYNMYDCGIIETYNPAINPNIDVSTNAAIGSITLQTAYNQQLTGIMWYREDNSNRIINTGTANTYIHPAQISATSGLCLPNTTVTTEPVSPTAPWTQWGVFKLPITSPNNALVVERNIPDTSIVMDVINGADAKATWGIISNTNMFPSIYELMSADVNGSGMVTSGDITLIHQRSTMQITHFPNGVPDWVFLTDSILANPNYKMVADGGFAHKHNVPANPTCLSLMHNYGNQCNSYNDEVLHGLMIGDVNGNWNNMMHGSTKSNEEVVLNIDNAIALGNGAYKIPLTYIATTPVSSINFNLGYDNSKVSVTNVITAPAALNAGGQMLWNDFNNDKLLMSAHFTNDIQTTNEVYYVEVLTNGNGLKDYYFGNSNVAYLNGEPVNLTIIGGTTSTEETAIYENIAVYPNPTKYHFTIDYRDYVQDVNSIALYNLSGQLLQSIEVSATGISNVSTDNLTGGVYIVSINGVKHIKVVKVQN